ncbi:UNVERIFIED_CONTAM: hypothetical protein HDU68_008849 [Siphonaria sp. JEL0065]|nr:hypothetical protein HDU68_008849 [Siphonaria sp. JEL0065]
MNPVTLLFLSACATLSFAATCHQSFSVVQFANCLQVAPTIAFHWNITNDQASILIGVDSDVPAGNWIGIGLTASGAMKGADLWILKQDQKGVYTIQDSHSNDYVTPSADARQDVTLVTAPNPGNNSLSYIFRRALVTSDPQDLPIIQNVENQMVWAYGDSSTLIQQHLPQSRGTFSTVLFPDLPIAEITQPTDLRSFSVLMPNVTVPPATTTYKCMGFSAPVGDFHMTQIESIVVSNYTHHSVLYACRTPVSLEPYDCTLHEPSCRDTLYMNNKKGSHQSMYSFPQDAGLRIGSAVEGVVHLMLQVHYSNFDGKANTLDASGFKVYYSNIHRKYDVGVLVLGSLEINIPGASATPTVVGPNICSAKCTGQFGSNLTVFRAQPHMHMLGMSQTVNSFRDGIHQQSVLNANPFDFRFQTPVAPGLFGTDITLMPGDELRTVCNYAPTQGLRQGSTSYGVTLKDEMCYAYLYYYPRMTIGVCISYQFPKYEVCEGFATSPAINSPNDLPYLPEAETIIVYGTLLGYPAFFVVHAIASVILQLVKGFDKPKKFVMYLLYVIPEFICFVLIIVYFLAPIIQNVHDDKFWMFLTATEYQYAVGASFYMTVMFIYDMVFDSSIQPMLLLHHTTAVFAIISCAIFIVSIDDIVLQQYILLTGFCLANHLTIDWLPHTYLILRKVKGPRSLIWVFETLSAWPLTIYRFLVCVFFIFIVRFFASRTDITSPVFITWTTFVAAAFAILSISQVWAHGVYVLIAAKDRKVREGNGIEKQKLEEVEFLQSSEN